MQNKKRVRFVVGREGDPLGFYDEIGLSLDIDIHFDRERNKWKASTIYDDGNRYESYDENYVTALLKIINQIVGRGHESI